MTELENLKIELFNLVERVSTLSTKNEGTFSFTKEQLLSYSKFLIDEAVESITTGIKNDITEDSIDEIIELEMGYDRDIRVTIDERGFHSQIVSVIEDSIDSNIEDSVTSALEHVFPSIQD